MAVGEPSELSGQLVAFADCRPDCHRKAIGEDARDVALESAQMVDIGDDALARRAAHRSDQCHAARRHIDDLARKLAAVRQHVAAEQVDLDALMTAAILAERPQARSCFSSQSHGFIVPVARNRKPRAAILMARYSQWREAAGLLRERLCATALMDHQASARGHEAGKNSPLCRATDMAAAA